MKKTISLLGLVWLATVTELFAINVDLQQGPYSYGVGGEFVAADGNPAVAPGPGVYSLYGHYYSNLTKYTGANGLPGFGTFCIEYNEEFYPGNTYKVTDIGANALWGGQKATGGDPISKGTAMLYSLYATGNQDFGYNWGSGRLTSARDLQLAIWWLEDEGPGGPVQYDSGNNFMKLVVDTFGSQAAAKADNNGLYHVAAMTLGDPGAAQDQLVLVPDVASTALLLGLTISLIAILRSKLQQSQRRHS